ncbi:hypothetical protein LCGC14_1689790 [marine sediment metagenome]|uniref:Uncharacterized protein n=1 Tax=marine sediment metagenome TaxID=412755 RepID=A0A0F9HLM9_9ZZZZ
MPDDKYSCSDIKHPNWRKKDKICLTPVTFSDFNLINIKQKQEGEPTSEKVCGAFEQSMGLKQIILEQLNYYSSTGQRKYSILQVSAMIGISEPTTRKRIKEVLLLLISPIHSDIQKSNTVYRMIFGKITISYHDLRQGALIAGLKLITSPSAFFNIVKNNHSISKQKVEVECKLKHLSLRTISRVKEASRVCKTCADIEWQKSVKKLNLDKEISFNRILDLAQDRNLEVVSFTNPDLPLTQAEFHNLKQANALLNKRNREIVFMWKHKDCKRIFNSKYRNIQEGLSHCPYCNINVDQRITHNMVELIFSKYNTSFSKEFESEKKLKEILAIEGYENLLELNMKSIKDIYRSRITIDCFAILNINRRKIKLSIEHDGAQHDKREKIGIDAMIALSKINGILLTYNEARDRWEAQLKRDNELKNLFDILKKSDYFLIQVPYTVKGNARYEFIIKEFERQTDEPINFNLADVPNWKSLLKTF